MPPLRPPFGFPCRVENTFVGCSGPEASSATGASKTGVSTRTSRTTAGVTFQRRPANFAPGHSFRFDHPRAEAAGPEDASGCRASAATPRQSADAAKAFGQTRRPPPDES